MAVTDMSLEQLEKYQGMSPYPSDFDAFWDAGLAEMRAVDPQVELTPISFPCKHSSLYDLYFTGVGGSRIHAKLLIPNGIPKPAPALFQFHGYSGNCGDWFDKLPYAAEGFVVAAMDCRGQGGRSQDLGGVTGTTLNGHIIRGLSEGPGHLLMRSVFLDTVELVSIVAAMPQVDETRMATMGGSQGGALSLACAALVPQIKKTVSLYPFLSDYVRVWNMEADQHAYHELQLYLRYHDPLHERFDEIFHTLGYIDVQNMAHRVQAEVLMAITLRDTVCPPSTQFAVYNKIPSTKRRVLYPEFGHEALPRIGDIGFEFLVEMK